MCDDLKHDSLEKLDFRYCRVFGCKFIPFWTLTYPSQTICESGKVLSHKVNNVNLYINNRVQIFYSAKQFCTLFILLGCKNMNADIIQILHILLLRSGFSPHSTFTLTWSWFLSLSLYWTLHWNVVFLGLSEVGMILLPEMNGGT